MALPILKFLGEIPPYVPGKPIEEVARELGVRDAVKLASNENPIGVSPAARKAVEQRLDDLFRYPDAASFDLKEALIRRLDRPAESVVLGNGSDEIITLCCLALLEPGLSAVAPRPGFSTYQTAVKLTGATLREVDLDDFRQDLPAMAAAVDQTTRIVILNNPHNPTGTALGRTELEVFLRNLPPDVLVILDEAYIDFVTDDEVARGLELADGQRPVAALWTFSKIYGLAGLRIGYAVMPIELAAVFERIRMPFNVNLPAQAAALAALDDTAFYDRSRRVVTEGLNYFYENLDRLGLWYLPSQANFVMVRVTPTPQSLEFDQYMLESPSQAVHRALLREGVIVRPLDNYGLPDYIRVNAGLPAENEKFIAALARVLGR